MSNGLSGLTQYIHSAAAGKAEQARQAKKEAFNKYIISYVECISKKACTCSACKTENAIKLVEVARTSEGVTETWKCGHCGRTVKRFVSNAEFGKWLNEDRQRTA